MCVCVCTKIKRERTKGISKDVEILKYKEESYQMMNMSQGYWGFFLIYYLYDVSIILKYINIQLPPMEKNMSLTTWSFELP